MSHRLIYKVATRESALAQKQSRILCDHLKKQSPDFDYLLVPFVTQGDRKPQTPLKEIGGKGVFIKELEYALLEKQADFAIHSLKDMPLEQNPGLELAGFFSDVSAQDVLISSYGHWKHLPKGASVGTSSLRRAAQILLLRPDLKVRPLRGNILTRLEKWRLEEYDALVLAKAGLERMNLWEPTWYTFELNELVPAFNQGILCLQSQFGREDVQHLCQSCLDDSHLQKRALYERQIASLFGASCQSAIGIHIAFLNETQFVLYVFAALSLEDSKYCSEVFDHIQEAIVWTKKIFSLDRKSWALCQNFFI